MSNWTDGLTPEERDTWDDFVDHFRRDALGKIAGSGVFLSLVPSAEDFDVKFAAELGTAIMLDKPLIIVIAPGVELPTKLRLIADQVVCADLDTEDGRRAIADALKEI